MDDNKLLTLANGERIRLQSHCALLFEVRLNFYQLNTFPYTFCNFQNNHVRKLHRHRLEICSTLPLLLFPAVGWFLLTPKTCDTPRTGRDGWTTDLMGYEKKHLHYVIIALVYNLIISHCLCFFSRNKKCSTNCLRNMCPALLTWLWMVLLMANRARNWRLLFLRQIWTWWVNTSPSQM